MLIRPLLGAPRAIGPPDLVRARVPDDFWNVTLEQVPDALAYKTWLSRYVSKLGRMLKDGIGLYLWGEWSSGKTGAAIVVLKAALAYGAPGMFLAAPEVVEAFLGRDFDEEQTLADRAREVPFLVLDDIGQEANSERVAPFVERLIRSRSHARRVTIVTSNLSPKNLKMRYPSIAAVLEGCCVEVCVVGHNWRRAEAEKNRAALMGEEGDDRGGVSRLGSSDAGDNGASRPRAPSGDHRGDAV